jgi:hypothetical protein
MINADWCEKARVCQFYNFAAVASNFHFLPSVLGDLIGCCRCRAPTMVLGGAGMLQSLSDHMRNCLQRAEIAGTQAKETDDLVRKAEFLNLEKSWVVLPGALSLPSGLSDSCSITAQPECRSGSRLRRRRLIRSRARRLPWRAAARARIPPARRVLGGWINAETKKRIDLHPPIGANGATGSRQTGSRPVRQ